MEILATGIDVSYAQGKVDWKKMKDGGVEFAMLRAGYGKTASQKDAQFEANYAGCKANGVPCGAYWYSYATDAEDAKAEASACLAVLAGKKFEYPIAFDIEEARSRENASEIARTFCEILENNRYFVQIYASKSYLLECISPEIRSRYNIWVAQYYTEVTYPDNYGIWQFTSKNGVFPCFSGNLDIDYAYQNYPEIIKRKGLNGFTEIGKEVEEKLVDKTSDETVDKTEPVFSNKVEKRENPYPVPTSTLYKGCKGETVKWLQFILEEKGFSVGEFGIDGSFGGDTLSAVHKFQKSENLEVDGRVGPKTRAALLK